MGSECSISMGEYIYGAGAGALNKRVTVSAFALLCPLLPMCVSHNSRPTNNFKWAGIDFYIFELPKSLLTLGGASECTVFVCLLLPPVCVTHLNRPTHLPGVGHINQTACLSMNWKHVLIVVRFRDQGVFLVMKSLFLSSGFQLEIGIHQNFAHIMSTS